MEHGEPFSSHDAIDMLDRNRAMLNSFAGAANLTIPQKAMLKAAATDLQIVARVLLAMNVNLLGVCRRAERAVREARS